MSFGALLAAIDAIDAALVATGVRALAVLSSGRSAAVDVARRRGLPIFEIPSWPVGAAGRADRRAATDDVALVLRTSGSTALRT